MRHREMQIMTVNLVTRTEARYVLQKKLQEYRSVASNYVNI